MNRGGTASSKRATEWITRTPPAGAWPLNVHAERWSLSAIGVDVVFILPSLFSPSWKFPNLATSIINPYPLQTTTTSLLSHYIAIHESFPTFFVILHSKLWNFSIPPKSLARNKIRLNFVLDSTRIPPFLLPEIGHIPLSKRRKERKKRYRFSSTRHVLHPTPFFSEKIMGKKDEYRSYLPWPILLSPRSSSLSKRNGRPRNTYSVPAPTAKGPRKWPGNRRTTMSSLRRIGRPSPRWRRPAGSQVAAINPPMLLQVCESHAARRNVTRPAQNSFAGNA